MKRTSVIGRVSSRAGFTLVEMLVVIAIIGILAALLLPTLARAKVQAKIHQAKIEESGIISAIREYESDNSLYPVSKAALASASAAGAEDFTCGTYNVACAGLAGPNASGAGFTTPTSGSLYPITTPGNYQTNNAEVMAILMDLENFANGAPTVNLGHMRNPKRTAYLHANFANDTKSPGVGQDGVYRDPWGNPYIITLDLNGDNKGRDAFYRRQLVSQQQSGSGAGFNGLVNASPDVNSDNFEANLPVMVWSAGPDKMIDQNSHANDGVNKDNVLSWKQ